MAKITSFTIYDSSVDYSYEDYVSYCKDNCEKPQTEDSDAYYDWVGIMRNDDYYDFIEGIKYIEGYDEPCIISGKLGLWDGEHEIQPVPMTSLLSAIHKCNGQDIEAIEVKFNKGAIEVEARHHDGTNHFTISRLTEVGYSIAERQQENGDLTSTQDMKSYWMRKYKAVA